VKWDVAYQRRVESTRDPPRTRPQLDAEITRIARRTYKALGLSATRASTCASTKRASST